jgi:gamma-glutamyltranspeptidase/glutathione hydrolase
MSTDPSCAADRFILRPSGSKAEGSRRRRNAGSHRAARRAATTLCAALLVAAGTIRAGDLPGELRTVEASGTRGVVVANTREAAAAGARMLNIGGNAVDAAVAAALTLGVSEAEASGIGGNAWILIHLAGGLDVAIDGSALVPTQVRPQELKGLLDDGLTFGYKTVAAPGGLAALADALRRYGHLSFAEVIAPAIEVAERGIRLTPHQHAVVGAFGWKLTGSPTLRDLFLTPSLEACPLDHIYCLDAMARTLRRLAALGLRDFYVGGTADAINADMAANGGYLRKADLALVHPVYRAPLRGRYRGYEVISFPYPGGGGAVIEALQILDRFPREMVTQDDANGLMLRLEAVRIALYDLYAADEAGPVGQLLLLNPEHAAQRASQINLARARTVQEILGRNLVAPRQEGSTHVSVIDGQGNAAAISLTFNEEFGACVATPELGFPYNATLAMYDPSRPESPFYPRPGNVLPHSMAPTIVLRGGKPFLVLGGPGSARITSSLVGTIVNVIDGGMDIAGAVAAPRVLWDGSSEPRVMIEMAPPNTDAEVVELRRRGFPEIYTLRFPPRPIDLLAFGGVNLVTLDSAGGRVSGAGDPRRAGTAVAAGPHD